MTATKAMPRMIRRDVRDFATTDSGLRSAIWMRAAKAARYGIATMYVDAMGA